MKTMTIVLYECDAYNNTECSKTGCYLNGGPCFCTADVTEARTRDAGVPIVADRFERTIHERPIIAPSLEKMTHVNY